MQVRHVPLTNGSCWLLGPYSIHTIYQRPANPVHAIIMCSTPTRGDFSFMYTGWSKKLEMRWIFCSNPSSDFSDVIVIQFCLIFAARCAAFAVIRCLSVCVSVCLSVTFVHSVKTSTHILRLFSPSGRSVILVFPYETEKQYCDGNPPNGASNARGMKKSRFSTNISLYLGIDEDRAIVTMEGE